MMALTALTIPTKGALSCSTVCFAVLFANSLFESTIQDKITFSIMKAPPMKQLFSTDEPPYHCFHYLGQI